MRAELVNNPEIGHIYLVRRFLNGPLADRYQPAMISGRHTESFESGKQEILTVCWLDNAEVEILPDHICDVRAISRKWLRDEVIRYTRKTEELAKKLDVVKKLQAAELSNYVLNQNIHQLAINS